MTGMIYNILKNPNELKPHKTNIDIYGTESVDIDLVESIKNKGILEPLVIVDDNTILSGHRRWLAAKELKLERIPCRSMSFSDELDEKEALIEFNRQRSKTYSQRMNEADLLTSVYSERARKRQSEMARSTHLKEISKQVVPTSAPHKEKKPVEEPIATPKDNKVKENIGKTRDIVAEKVGLKKDTYTKVKKVWDTAKTGDIYAKSLVEKLDKEDVSANEASKRIKVYQEAPEPIKKKIIKEDLTAKEAVVAIEEIKKPEEGMSEHSRKVLFSSESDNWATPKELYDDLNNEFDFDFDPCPFNSTFDGLNTEWKKSNFINPPYSNIVGFLEKGHDEIKNGNAKTLVYLIPVRTDTKWFHNYVYPYFKRECKPYADIRFIKGRVRFENGTGVKNSAPFPSMLVVFGVD